MRRLQRQRSLAVYEHNLAKVEQWKAPVIYRLAGIVTLMFVMIAFTSSQLRLLSVQLLSNTMLNTLQASLNAENVQIKHIAISIQPPEYTGLPATDSSLADLEIVENSLVQWDLVFSQQADGHFLKLSDGQQIALSRDENSHWRASSTITRTDLYRIIQKTSDLETSIGDVYALTVTLDQAPEIRILDPGTFNPGDSQTGARPASVAAY